MELLLNVFKMSFLETSSCNEILIKLTLDVRQIDA